MILHQLFCDTDDFCQHYLPDWRRTQLQTGDRKRIRRKWLCESEIMTIVVYFQMSGYRTFKHFYLRHVLVHWQPQFPRLPSYNRFVELMAEVLNPLTAFMHSRCGKSEGIAFVDSTPLCVCKNIRIPRHKTFANHARQQGGFMVSSYTLRSMIVVTSCHFV